MVSRSQAETRRIIWDLRDTDTVTQTLPEALSRALEDNHLRSTMVTTLNVEGNEYSLAPAAPITSSA